MQRTHRWLLPAIALAMILSACGGDDDTADATTTSAEASEQSATDAIDDAAGGAEGANSSDSSGQDATSDGPAGSATMTVGDITVEGGIVGCTLVEPDVEFTAQGETAQFEVYMLADGSGEAGVTVSGGFQFEGRGTVGFSGASIDQGNVTIVGSGAQPDDSAPIEDFTIDATIESC